MLYLIQPKRSVFTIAVSLFSFFSSPLSSYAQKQAGETDAVFILRGNTRMQSSGKPAEGVELVLKKNGQTVTKIVTTKNGKYYLEMNISILNKNNEYLLYITKPGTVPKSISINTFISADEFASNTFPRYLFDLEIKITETQAKDIIIEKPSGRLIWDASQHAFAFDQTFAKIKEDDTEKLLAEKKRREEEEAKKRAEEEARKKAEEDAKLKADAEARLLADRRSKEDADRALQKNLEAMKLEIQRKRTQDSLDSLAIAARGNAVVEIKRFSRPVSPEDVDQNAFDGTGAFSINIAKRSLKAFQQKMNKEKADNLSAKYETNNTLTSLLNMVDEFEKNKKSTAKSTKL